MDGSDRLRLFCALCLPEDALDAVVAWQARELSRGRIVPRENLHLTLAFLGSQRTADVAAIAGALREATVGAGGLVLRVRGYRETRSVGMLVLDDEGERATALAGRLQERLERLGLYRREDRPWLPHLTVLRFRNQGGFRERPRLRPSLPELGAVVPSDAAVFISRPRPSGAVYEAVESVSLLGEG